MSGMGFNQAFSFTQACGFDSGFSYEDTVRHAGIKNDLYSGYFGDDMSWFNGRAIVSTTYPTNVIQDPDTDDGDGFSRRWTGYFNPPSTETYTFYLSSDDASYLWIGNVALSGWSAGNAVVNNGGLHGDVEVSGAVSLVGGLLYPIQVFFGENTGGDTLLLSYSTPTIAKTSNLTGLIYYNPNSLDGRGF